MCLSLNALISRSVLKDRLLNLVIFTGSCLFSELEALFHAFLDFMVVDKRDVVLLVLPMWPVLLIQCSSFIMNRCHVFDDISWEDSFLVLFK